MKDIQEKAKRRFPIGCTFESAQGGPEIVLRQDNTTYKIEGYAIYTHEGGGCLYLRGTWATLISYPEGYIVPGEVRNQYQIY